MIGARAHVSIHGSLWLLICVVGLACAKGTYAADSLLADPAQMLSTATRMDFVGENKLTIEHANDEFCLRSVPMRSSSALYHKLDEESGRVRLVKWTWRVDKLQKSADLRNLEREDVAATVMFVFGEPSLFNKDVPTLAYTWTATPVPDGTVVSSRRYSSLAYLKLRGEADVGAWQTEERDILADFRAIFGREPGDLRYVAVFNDNDQTGEPTSALFGRIVTRSKGRVRKVAGPE